MKSQVNRNFTDFNSDSHNFEMKMRNSNIRSGFNEPINPMMSPYNFKDAYNIDQLNPQLNNNFMTNFNGRKTHNEKNKIYQKNTSASMQNLNNFGHLKDARFHADQKKLFIKASQLLQEEEEQLLARSGIRNIKTSKSIKLMKPSHTHKSSRNLIHLKKRKNMKNSNSTISKTMKTNKTKKSLIKSKNLSKREKSIIRISTIKHAQNPNGNKSKEITTQRGSRSRSKSIINTRIESERDLSNVNKSIIQTRIIYTKNDDNKKKRKKKETSQEIKKKRLYGKYYSKKDLHKIASRKKFMDKKNVPLFNEKQNNIKDFHRRVKTNMNIRENIGAPEQYNSPSNFSPNQINGFFNGPNFHMRYASKNMEDYMQHDLLSQTPTVNNNPESHPNSTQNNIMISHISRKPYAHEISSSKVTSEYLQGKSPYIKNSESYSHFGKKSQRLINHHHHQSQATLQVDSTKLYKNNYEKSKQLYNKQMSNVKIGLSPYENSKFNQASQKYIQNQYNNEYGDYPLKFTKNKYKSKGKLLNSHAFSNSTTLNKGHTKNKYSSGSTTFLYKNFPKNYHQNE